MIKGYKATYNYKCQDLTYEIGQEYKLDEKPIMCKYGFHYCLEADNTLKYYSHAHNFKLLEIEDLSSDTISDGHKSCSNHIKIIREVADKEELYQLFEQEYTYNENGKVLTFKNSQGYWYKCIYSSNEREEFWTDSYGFWSKRTYDENEHLLTHDRGII